MPASSLASSPAPIRVDPFLRARQILRFSTRAEVPWREMVTDDDKAAARELLSLAEENDGEDEVAAEEEQWPEKWSDNKRSLSSTLAHFRAVVRGAQAAQLGRQDQQRHDAPGDVGAGQERGEDESNGASLNALDEADEDAVLQGDDEEGMCRAAPAVLSQYADNLIYRTGQA